MEGLMAQDADWFYQLPYKGAMSKEAAKNLEIEKRAIWRRVIYDANRSKLTGLRWETRGDDRAVATVKRWKAGFFLWQNMMPLNQRVMHLDADVIWCR